MSATLSVTFWGVRGSYPMPGPQTARIGGNTACVEVRAGKHLIILDAGTGIIGLGRALMAQQRNDHHPITANTLFPHSPRSHAGLSIFSTDLYPLHYPLRLWAQNTFRRFGTSPLACHVAAGLSGGF
jgi:hypothetical protein